MKSSSIIKDLSNSCVDDAGRAYGYFFFDSRDSQKGLQRHEHLIRSLIWQFSQQYDAFPKALIDLYNQCRSGGQQPSTESLQNTLLLILDGFRHAFLVVDALDECTEQSKLLKWINEIARWKGGKLHLLATSRHERDIEKGLQSLRPILISLEGASVDLDIEAYLDQMLRDDLNQMEWSWDEEICAQVKTSLSQGAQGMYGFCASTPFMAYPSPRFRWVALQLDELRRCRSRYQIEKQLVCLPKDLYESYDRIVQRIDERDCKDARKVFHWLAFSTRPLELVELAEVVTVDFESQDEPSFDRKRRYYDPKAILSVCSGFVSVMQGTVNVITQGGRFALTE